MEHPRFASVVLVDPSLQHLNRTFTYAVPDGMACARGSLVRVPFHRRNRLGIIVEQLAEPDIERPLPIVAVLGPGLPEDIMGLAAWTAERYLATPGEALGTALPERVAAEERIPQDPAPVAAGPEMTTTPLHTSIRSGDRRWFVWRPRADERRGAVIASLVEAAVDSGGGALVLVPEVRVQGEVAVMLAEMFGEAVASLGSDRTARQRYREWLALRTGAKRIALGGRGAVFAPVVDLRLIVVDDEAHASYKEGRAPRFHARAVATERARDAGATLVLVGVPPSIEARTAAATPALTLLAPPRAQERGARPPVTVIDRSDTSERLVPGGATLTMAKRALAAGRRVVVLTHRGGADAIAVAERTIRILAPASPAVLDARADGEALEQAASGADCIVATPFIAKDLRVSGAGLLAIVEADAALAQPEFRAAEDAFATWWQASRWADRVVVETADPRHPAIEALIRWDPDVLWRAESARRRELGYPPFASLARIDVPGERAQAVADEIAAVSGGAVEVLGPVERNGRWVVMVRAGRREELLATLRPLVDRWRDADEPMRVDVDPREVLVPKWRS